MATDSLYFIMYFFTVRAYKYKFNTSPEVDSVFSQKKLWVAKNQRQVAKSKEQLTKNQSQLNKAKC